MNTFEKPTIIELAEKKLVGKCLEMSFAENKTAELWRNFMPRRAEIQNALSAELFSLQVYSDEHFFSNFNPTAPFTKWALREVANFEHIPQDMQAFTLASGLYAVFRYKGNPNNAAIFSYILGEWLPNSEYELADRPHFEVLGEKYKQNDDNSEEEIWVPIKYKQIFSSNN